MLKTVYLYLDLPIQLLGSLSKQALGKLELLAGDYTRTMTWILFPRVQFMRMHAEKVSCGKHI
jgi:hypothetical protein